MEKDMARSRSTHGPSPEEDRSSSGKTRRRREPVEVDLKKQGGPTAYTDGSMGVVLPSDIPVYLRTFRLVERDDTRPRGSGDALVGWTVQLDCFTYGVKVLLRIGRDGTLRLFVEDGDGREKVVEWVK